MKWLHNLLKGATLTTALFIFQACYGTKESYFDTSAIHDAPMSFSLVSAESGKPLEGIHILCRANKWTSAAYEEIGISGNDGKCRVSLKYSGDLEGPFIRFEDPEGVIASKDTTLADLRDREILVKLNAVK